MAKARRDIAQEVTDKILEQLDKGIVPWVKPWQSTGFQMPRSMSTGKLYRGVNVFLLGFNGYSSPWYGTFKQIQAKGGQVRKGEHGHLVVFYKTLTVEDRDNPGEEKQIPLLRNFTVFNAEQCDGLPDKYFPTKSEVVDYGLEPIESCEMIVKDWVNRGPMLSHSDDSGAYYSPSHDMVNVPKMSLFKSAEGYYSTMFHEFTHSTGHSKRLDRGFGIDHVFGTPLYAAEELVAEMGAAMLCALTGIENQEQFEQTVSYLDNWRRVLKSDKQVFLKSAAKAQRAVDMIAPPMDEAEEEDSE